MKSSRSFFLRSVSSVLIAPPSRAREAGCRRPPAFPVGRVLLLDRHPYVLGCVVLHERQLLLGDRGVVLLVERHRPLETVVVLDVVQAVLELVRISRFRR